MGDNGVLGYDGHGIGDPVAEEILRSEFGVGNSRPVISRDSSGGLINPNGKIENSPRKNNRPVREGRLENIIPEVRTHVDNGNTVPVSYMEGRTVNYGGETGYRAEDSFLFNIGERYLRGNFLRAYDSLSEAERRTAEEAFDYLSHALNNGSESYEILELYSPDEYTHEIVRRE